MGAPSSILIIAATIIVASATNSTDDWVKVNGTDIVQSQESCVQRCVVNVNQNIFVGNIPCQTYGCVCAESTHGLNFEYGLSNVTECAKKSCIGQEAVTNARTAFQDLCLVYAANSTQPKPSSGKITRITSPAYEKLTDCAKFALNGCLDDNGNRNEQNCGPVNKLEHWQEYRGVAAQRQCSTPECLCKLPYFDASFAVAYYAGENYCNMWVSTDGLNNTEYEDMQNVFATYCTAAGFPPKDWSLRIVGNPPGSNETKPGGGWTRDENLQMGFGAGLGIPTLLLTGFAAWFSWGMLQLAKEAKLVNDDGS